MKSSTFSTETREAPHFRVRSTPMEGASTVLKQSVTHTSPVRIKAILFSKLHKHAQRNTPCTEILQSKKKPACSVLKKLQTNPTTPTSSKSEKRHLGWGIEAKNYFKLLAAFELRNPEL